MYKLWRAKKVHIITSLLLFSWLISLTVPLTGCSSDADVTNDINAVTYFTDIPGITDEEIAAIRALQASGRAFSYGVLLSTEAFISTENELDGFAVLFSDFLSSLFGMDFNVKLYGWSELLSGLENQLLDFTGELTPTLARTTSDKFLFEVDGEFVPGKGYAMSSPIAERMLRIFTLYDSQIERESDLEGLRIGFLEDTGLDTDITRTYRINFDSILLRMPKENPDNLDEYDIAIEMLHSGEIDAFVMPAPAYAAFEYHDDVLSRPFFPMIYSPVSLTTANHELESIVSALSKFIDAGGADVLLELYREGDFRYAQNKLRETLTNKEKWFISNTIHSEDTVLVGFEHDNYPLSFFNESTNRFEGVAVDILEEVTRLTGLRFVPGTSPTAPWTEIYSMLVDGEVAMVSELIRTDEREQTENFLWTSVPYSKTNYILMSRVDAPLYAVHQVRRLSVGLRRGSGEVSVFNFLFPTTLPVTFYDTQIEGLDALDRGEIDLLFGSEFDLLYDVNYRERTGLKVNIRLDYMMESYFGFNAEQYMLRSIIDKAQEFIDTETIVTGWTGRQFDYFRMMSAQRTSFLIYIITIMVLGMAFLAWGLRRNIKLRKNFIGAQMELQSVEKHRIEAEAASHAKSAFLATMSHEIRTPLNAVLGITEIELLNDNLDLSTRDALTKIYTSGDILLGIINDILDLSKIESGKFELIIEDYELASLISDTAHLNIMRIGSKEIVFTLIVDENIPTFLTGDVLRVKQILNNILSNAFKYTYEGEVKMTVSTEPYEEDDEHLILKIVVKDTGQGMSEEQVSKLFDEYSRFNLETNRTTEGTGLGMSIVKNLISLMDGTISVESEIKKGTTFTIRLPQGIASDEVLGPENAENLHRFSAITTESKMRSQQITREHMPYGSVLIVDDVETNIFVASGLMVPYGLKIDTVTSGFDAIEKIKDGNVYDIVFMDHMMPKMDGVETTRIIREMEYSEIIVALTANAVAGQSEVFLKGGFNDFISKPIDVRQLNIILNKHIRDKQPPEVIEAARKEAENRKPDEMPIDAASNAMMCEIFVRDATKSIQIIEEVLDKGVSGDGDLNAYVINVHGIKSALGNIGKPDLSKTAGKLEKLGQDRNIELIIQETKPFLESLKAVVNELRVEEEHDDVDTAEEKSFLFEKLETIKEACLEYDEQSADAALVELREKSWTKSVSDFLVILSEYLLHSDFDDMIIEIDKFMEEHK